MINDPQHVWTLNEADEFWIGNFTTQALFEAGLFWVSDEGKAAQPNLPGYAEEMVRQITDELTRREVR